MALQHHSHAKAMPHSQLGLHDLEQAPVDASGRVKVAFAFYATKILSLDHLENTLRIVGFVRQWWYDPRLEWDGEGPEQFRPKKSSEIWKPDTTLMNSVQFNYGEKCQDVDLYNYAKGATVKVGDGRMKFNVFWSRPCMLEAKCDVNLRWFPFDRNECHLNFESWASPHVEFDICKTAMGSEISIPEFDVSMDKTAVRPSTHRTLFRSDSDPWQEVSVQIDITRHGNYYVVNYVCPLMLMHILSWLSFEIPVGSSDRVQYMVTVVLTVMTINFLTASQRPATATEMWLDDFQTTSLCMVAFVTCYTVALYRFAPQEDWDKERKHRRAALIKFMDRTARVGFLVVLMVAMIYWWPPLLSARPEAYKELTTTTSLWVYILVAFSGIGMLCLIALSWFEAEWVHNTVRRLEDWRIELEHPGTLKGDLPSLSQSPQPRPRCPPAEVSPRALAEPEDPRTAGVAP